MKNWSEAKNVAFIFLFSAIKPTGTFVEHRVSQMKSGTYFSFFHAIHPVIGVQSFSGVAAWYSQSQGFLFHTSCLKWFSFASSVLCSSLHRAFFLPGLHFRL